MNARQLEAAWGISKSANRRSLLHYEIVADRNGDIHGLHLYGQKFVSVISHTKPEDLAKSIKNAAQAVQKEVGTFYGKHLTDQPFFRPSISDMSCRAINGHLYFRYDVECNYSGLSSWEEEETFFNSSANLERLLERAGLTEKKSGSW